MKRLFVGIVFCCLFAATAKSQHSMAFEAADMSPAGLEQKIKDHVATTWKFLEEESPTKVYGVVPTVSFKDDVATLVVDIHGKNEDGMQHREQFEVTYINLDFRFREIQQFLADLHKESVKAQQKGFLATYHQMRGDWNPSDEAALEAFKKDLGREDVDLQSRFLKIKTNIFPQELRAAPLLRNGVKYIGIYVVDPNWYQGNLTEHLSLVSAYPIRDIIDTSDQKVVEMLFKLQQDVARERKSEGFAPIINPHKV